MYAIKQLLPQSLRRARVEDQVRASQVLEECERILCSIWGPAFKKNAFPQSFREGTLVLRAYNSPCMTEIKMKEKEIIYRLQRTFPRAVIKGVRCVRK